MKEDSKQEFHEPLSFNKSQSENKITIRNQSKEQLKEIFCSEGKPCFLLCCNKECQQQAVVCKNDECNCHIVHEKQHFCNFVSAQLILGRTLNKKKTVQKQFHVSIVKQLEDLVDWISEQIEKIQKQVENIGLSEKQTLLIDMIREKKVNSLTGKIVHEAYQQLKIAKRTDVEKFQKLFQDASQQEIRDTKKHVNNISELLEKYSNSKKPLHDLKYLGLDFELKSKIIINKEESETLRNFLPNSKRFKSVELKYRASENNFCVNQFHKKCDGVGNTITLIKTQYDKVIGGYTGIPWMSLGAQKKDPTNQTFIFSLTNKEKLSVIPGKTAVYHQKSNGPIFGDGSGLWIYDNANIEQVSNCNFSQSFQNQKYKQTNKDSWVLFQGGIGSSHEFKIKEWEVFQLIQQNY